MSGTAVIVGATGGIGSACAHELAGRGWSLVLNGRREEALTGLADQLGARAVVGDCTVASEVEALFEGLERVDLLVHAAGVLRGSPLREQTNEVFEDVVQTNLVSAHLAISQALPLMRAGSRIVLISSLAATRPTRGLTAYSAAKAGVNALAIALSAELESEGINVNLVSPGAVDTPMMEKSARAFGSLRAEDVAGVVGWLSSLEPRILVPDIFFRAPDRGPFSEMSGGGGTEGMAPSKPADG
ncbi:MAG TPA: SDR family oxidoreductase [Solirubrobacterales bacterium]|jgi:NAD(P)-dependent dehydrogenase (short-subunit alcohol dehydrogenase family)|nr:SDR family oxidoreductase [Solirubrobacterales bacterium]